MATANVTLGRLVAWANRDDDDAPEGRSYIVIASDAAYARTKARLVARTEGHPRWMLASVLHVERLDAVDGPAYAPGSARYEVVLEA